MSRILGFTLMQHTVAQKLARKCYVRPKHAERLVKTFGRARFADLIELGSSLDAIAIAIYEQREAL